MISNGEIVRILREIGEYLEMQNVAFKPRAYQKAADVIESLQEEVVHSYQMGGLKALKEMSGVGESIAEKIEELIRTGKLKYYEQLKKKAPVNLSQLTAVEGLGPKKIRALYQKLGIKNLKDLERAAKAGKIRDLEGFGRKTEESILTGIGFVKKSSGRVSLGAALPLAREFEKRLRGLKDVQIAQFAGSVRRRKETIGDIDLLVISDNPKPAMSYFISMPEVGRVLAHGDTKASVTLKSGLDVDLRILPKESYGSALNYFTGSKEHNVALRQLAIKKGWKLSEYGLFKATSDKGQGTRIAGKSEEKLYKMLGLDYIEPELREMTGEVEAAQKRKLPAVIGYGDLRGDLQVQSNWTDGADSIEEMAKAAMAAGLEYIAITDHTKRLAMTHGLDEKRIQQQWKEIDKLNAKLKSQKSKFLILKGTECDILKDGSMDLPDKILARLDIVGASVHSHFNLSIKEQTERIKKAMRNPHVDILFHPTGRLIQKREPYDVDMDELIGIAKETGTVLEIDAFPDRLDLKDEYIRKCVAAGVKMTIDSDAHSKFHFSVLEFGIAQARRGWAKRSDIINAWPLEKMLDFLKKK